MFTTVFPIRIAVMKCCGSFLQLRKYLPYAGFILMYFFILNHGSDMRAVSAAEKSDESARSATKSIITMLN
jgi:F0F1-type ATP synthase membrane subunit a